MRHAAHVPLPHCPSALDRNPVHLKVLHQSRPARQGRTVSIEQHCDVPVRVRPVVAAGLRAEQNDRGDRWPSFRPSADSLLEARRYRFQASLTRHRVVSLQSCWMRLFDRGVVLATARCCNGMPQYEAERVPARVRWRYRGRPTRRRLQESGDGAQRYRTEEAAGTPEVRMLPEALLAYLAEEWSRVSEVPLFRAANEFLGVPVEAGGAAS